VNASLQNTQFGQARAGLQRRWLVGQLALTLTMAALFNFIAALFSVILLRSYSSHQQLKKSPFFLV
jgi:hypothetical protein